MAKKKKNENIKDDKITKDLKPIKSSEEEQVTNSKDFNSLKEPINDFPDNIPELKPAEMNLEGSIPTENKTEPTTPGLIFKSIVDKSPYNLATISKESGVGIGVILSAMNNKHPFSKEESEALAPIFGIQKEFLFKIFNINR